MKKLNDESLGSMKKYISDVQLKIRQLDRDRENLLIKKGSISFDVIKIKTQIDEKQVYIKFILKKEMR
ncbi:MAG: hypothetical protein LBS15_01835 [Endomicrobium sp.]|nr:hypothetical protein [Endomicrobium sp.]